MELLLPPVLEVSGSRTAGWCSLDLDTERTYGASDWWPCINHPSSKADSVDIWITCLNSYKAVSQGKLIEALSNGDGTTTFKWKHRYKIATYLVSVTLTNFKSISYWYKYSPTDSMEVVNYVTPALDTCIPIIVLILR